MRIPHFETDDARLSSVQEVLLVRADQKMQRAYSLYRALMQRSARGARAQTPQTLFATATWLKRTQGFAARRKTDSVAVHTCFILRIAHISTW